MAICIFYEYDRVTQADLERRLNDAALAQRAFSQLSDMMYVRDDSAEDAFITTQAGACIRPSTKDGGKAITFTNYVGTISLECGVECEILPKIAYNGAPDGLQQSRNLVVEMLKTCFNIPIKSFQQAQLNTARLPVFECFIRLFIDEVTSLYKSGLRAGYVQCEGNERFFKGRLSFSKHVKHNFAHAERFYVTYSIYSFNRPENRLIKSALLYLYGKSRDAKNKSDMRRLICVFDEVEASANIPADFARCETGRAAKYYSRAISLCRVFLAAKSFTPYGGKDRAFALLFAMDKLFECYVANKVQSELPLQWKFKKQAKEKYLFDGSGVRTFLLEPDILLRDSAGEGVIIDTKWKRLCSDAGRNYDISQADMYQMYTYHTRYNNIKMVVLLYPYYSGVEDNMPEYSCEANGKNVRVVVRFVNLYEVLNGTKKVIESINSGSNL